MEGSNLKISNIIVYIVTGLSFALFTAYQVFLAVQISTQRAGRIIGIAFYVLLTAASFLALIRRPGFRILRSVLFIGGLFLLFVMKLFNASRIFEALDFSSTPTVLYAAVYVASQLGTLLLLVYYNVIRLNFPNMRKLTIAFMAVVIALYIACLVMECILIMKYSLNVDLSVKYTVLSRIFYCLGFVGTAVGFMLPTNRKNISDDEQFFNMNQNDEDIILAAPKEHKPDKDEMRGPVIDDTDIVF